MIDIIEISLCDDCKHKDTCVIAFEGWDICTNREEVEEGNG